MKKFQQLLSDDSQNQYGLQYKPIKPVRNLLKNIQNSYESKSVQNPEAVEIYLKSSPTKSLKIKVSKRSKIQKLKQTIQEKLSIPFEDQLVYLNGKQISVFSSITLNQKQIIHITDRKNIVGLDQHLAISIKVMAPSDLGFNGKVYSFSLSGGDTISILKNALLKHQDFHNLDQKFTFNFLQSGRMMSNRQTFSENLITKNCEMTCLLSENQVQTKFSNQCQSNDPTQQITYKRIQISSTKVKKQTYQQNQDQAHYGGLKFNRPRIPTNKFLVGKAKNPIYTKIFKVNPEIANEQYRPNGYNYQNQSNTSLQGSGFKKKKPYQDNYQTDDSSLMKKIIVRKSRQEVQKIALNCLIKQEAKQKQDEKKSVVSSSSNEEEQSYVPIRQQKDYRPNPLIPQRKMAPSQKIKINMELQKLFSGNFGNQQGRMNIFHNDDAENYSQSQGELPIQTNRSRVLIKNSSLRNSIGSKDSIFRITKDKKPNNRYGEEYIEQTDSTC